MSRNKVEYAIAALMNAPVEDDAVAADIRRAVDWLQEVLAEYPEQPSPLVRTLAKDIYLAKQRRDFWRNKLTFLPPSDPFHATVTEQEAMADMSYATLRMLLTEAGPEVAREVNKLILSF